jgi:hypothetical protein
MPEINKKVENTVHKIGGQFMHLETSGWDLGTSGNEISKKLHFLQLFSPNFNF